MRSGVGGGGGGGGGSGSGSGRFVEHTSKGQNLLISFTYLWSMTPFQFQFKIMHSQHNHVKHIFRKSQGKFGNTINEH